MMEKYTEQDLLDACNNPSPDIFVSFGGVVADFRKRAMLKQAEFASMVGISRGYLAAIENNKSPNIGLKVVENIAQQMNVDRISLAVLWYRTKDTMLP
jgi:transcriptional regulator with XRE-family HTH domain